MNKEVNRYQHLHHFLDQQLKGVIGRQLQQPTFDHLQDKLKKIEHKLLKLKENDHHVQWSGKVSHAQQTSGVHFQPQIEYQSEKYVGDRARQLKSNIKSKRQGSVQSEQYQENQYPEAKSIKKSHKKSKNKKHTKSQHKINHSDTPAKKLQSNSRPASSTNLIPNSYRQTTKKSKQKLPTSTKKKNPYQSSNYESRYKTSPRKYVKKMLQTNSSSAIQLKIVRKQLDQCQKSNAQLKLRMNQLKTYEQQCWKLKQVFDRCQQLRRRNRLHKKVK